MGDGCQPLAVVTAAAFWEGRGARPAALRDFDGFTDTFLSRVAGIRTEERIGNGGGGCCHLVTAALSELHGFGRLAVARIDPAGDVICACHYVSILPDGTIFDPTSDQFGEGDDMLILSTSDPRYDLYRPEFHEDFHPGLPECGDLSHWRQAWDMNPIIDQIAESVLRNERGQGWWLDDASQLLRYLEAEVALVSAEGPSSDAVRFSLWLSDDLRKSHPSLDSGSSPDP